MAIFKRKVGGKEVKPVPYKGKPNPQETKAKAIKDAEKNKEITLQEVKHKEKKAIKEVEPIEVIATLEVKKEEY